MSQYSGFQRWAHQLWLDVSSVKFWKGAAHHYLRLIYDLFAAGVTFALLLFAFGGPAAAIAISRSDDAIGLSFISPPLAWLLAIVAFVAAAAILVFAPAVDAAIDRWLLPPSATAALQYQVSALANARQGAVSSAQTERHRIERDLHDSVQPRLVSLAMTIGLAQTKLDNDLPEARKLINEAQDDAKSALVELRNVVRGMAPTILADRGLDAALSSVVQRTETSGVPTTSERLSAVSIARRSRVGRLLRRRRGIDQRRQARARHAGGGDGAVRRAGQGTARLGVRRRRRRRGRQRRRGRDRAPRSRRARAGGPRHLHGDQPGDRPHHRLGGAAMRIVIAEDSALLRAGIERILTDFGHEVVAGVSDATNLLRIVNELKPDLAILDVRMPPTFTDEGIRAAALLRSQNPESPVLVLSHYVEERYAADLIASDTRGFGYLLKDRVADVPTFLDAVTVVSGGGTVLDPEVVSQILVRSRRRSALDQLTPREQEVLQLMAEGRTNSAIASALHVSVGSAEKHIASIFAKFDLAPDDSENRRVLAVLRYLES